MRLINCRRSGQAPRHATTAQRTCCLRKSERSIDEYGGSASKPPGFFALSQDCWIGSKSGVWLAPTIPALSGLQLLPSSALSSAQVFKAYPKIAALENRTFHLLFKPDILTCYEQGLIPVRVYDLRCFLPEIIWVRRPPAMRQFFGRRRLEYR